MSIRTTATASGYISDREDWAGDPCGASCLLRESIGGEVRARPKNLGWLLKHWKEIERVEVRHPAYTEPGYCNREQPTHIVTYMIVYMRNGETFETPWQDMSLCRDWLRRPVLSGLPLRWYGEETEC